MDRRLRVEGVKCEREAHVINGVLEPASGVALHDHIADILSRVDLRGVERRALTRRPGDHEIAGFQPASALHEIERPRLLAHADDPLERRHPLREHSAVEERALGAS